MELAELVRHAVEGATSFIEAAGHELTVTVPDEPAYLEADPNRLTQVLTNLLHNSARCTPAGGKISLTVERQGREVLLTVADNGVGLPADEIEDIFEMFT